MFTRCWLSLFYAEDILNFVHTLMACPLVFPCCLDIIAIVNQVLQRQLRIKDVNILLYHV